jgi:2-polyprenyl-3-methyl-5-hydroxy-6-metoxy-1,4-benzoquinol methylase
MTCPCCDGPLAGFEIVNDKGAWRRCLLCGSLVNVRPRGTSPELYGAGYVRSIADNEENLPWAEREYLWAEVDEQRPETVLEVAPGGCWLLGLLRQRGWNVFGVDIAPEAAQIARDRYGADVETADFMQWGGGQYSLVIANHFLEHFAEPKPVLEKLLSHVGPRGRLFLHCPNPLSCDGAGWFHLAPEHLTIPTILGIGISANAVGGVVVASGALDQDLWVRIAHGTDAIGGS